MKLLELKNVSKSFGKVEAIANVNLHVNQNEILAFLGDNGAGKSTTIRVIAGVHAPTTGEVKVIGFDVSPEVIRGMEMGYIHLTSDQQPFLQGYLPVLSLCQQLVYGLAPLVVDTGNGYVTQDTYKEVAELAAKGLR